MVFFYLKIILGPFHTKIFFYISSSVGDARSQGTKNLIQNT